MKLEEIKEPVNLIVINCQSKNLTKLNLNNLID